LTLPNFWSVDRVREYWTDPDDNNVAGSYIAPRLYTTVLGALIAGEFDKGARILELGCNVGRNLDELCRRGFYNLHAVEINLGAVELGGATYPGLYYDLTVHGVDVGEFIDLDTGPYDLIFTVAHLEHLHHDTGWRVLDWMAANTGNIVTLEDEVTDMGYHYRRNYQDEFERRAFVQLYAWQNVSALELTKDFTLRRLKK